VIGVVFVLQLKVDKLKLIELCGTSESEFSSVSGCMCSPCWMCDYFIVFSIEWCYWFWTGCEWPACCRFLSPWRICVMTCLGLQRKKRMLGKCNQIEVCTFLYSVVDCNVFWDVSYSVHYFNIYFALKICFCIPLFCRFAWRFAK